MSSSTTDSASAKEGLKRSATTHLGFCLMYSGLSFRGLQLQTHGPTHETVEGILMQALSDLHLLRIDQGKPSSTVQLARSCRTDRGVHAVRNLVTLRLPTQALGELGGLEALVIRLNSQLPNVLRVAKISILTANFVPRHCCNRRVYRYLVPLYALMPRCDSWASWATQHPTLAQDISLLYSVSSENALSNCRVFSLSGREESEIIQSVCWLGDIAKTVERCNSQLLTHVVGSHRFHNFCVDTEVRGKTQYAKSISSLSDEAVRCIHRCEVVPQLYFLPTARSGPTARDYSNFCSVLEGASPLSAVSPPCDPYLPFLIFQIEGKSFLFNMIRKVVGTLLAIARGAREGIWEELLSPSRRGSAPLAPGENLFLSLSAYDGYDRSVRQSGSFRSIQQEWSGAVARACEAFAWDEITADVIDADLNRLPSLDTLLAVRHAYLEKKRPGMESEDAHVRPESSRGASPPSALNAAFSPVSAMTRFLRSLSMHNWAWSDVKIPQGCTIAGQSQREKKRIEVSKEKQEADCATLDDDTSRAAAEALHGGEDGWVYGGATYEEEQTLQEAQMKVLFRKRSRSWEP